MPLANQGVSILRELIEHQLAHAVRDPNGRAYHRTAHLPQRSVFVEMFGTSSPAARGESTVAGAIATEYRFGRHVSAFMSVGYDTDELLAVRPAFNVEF